MKIAGLGSRKDSLNLEVGIWKSEGESSLAHKLLSS
jgi:hypothetical protein